MTGATRMNTCLKIHNFEVKNIENALKVMKTKNQKFCTTVATKNFELQISGPIATQKHIFMTYECQKLFQHIEIDCRTHFWGKIKKRSSRWSLTGALTGALKRRLAG